MDWFVHDIIIMSKRLSANQVQLDKLFLNLILIYSLLEEIFLGILKKLETS